MTFPPPTPGQARILWAALTGLALALILALLIGTVWGLGQVLNTLAPVLWPIAVAGIIAYLLDPVVDMMERRHVPRPRAILCVFALAVLIVGGVAASVVPHLVRETGDLVSNVPAYSTRLQERVEVWVNNPPTLVRRFFDPVKTSLTGTNAPPAGTSGASTTEARPASPLSTIDWSALLGGDSAKSAAEWLTKALGRAAKWLFGQFNLVASFFGVIAGLALVPVYAFYLLLEKRGIQSNWPDYLPVSKSGFKDELVFVLRSINDYLIVFFRGQVLVATCDGILYGFGFLAIGLPYALLLGALAVPLTMIPFLGAIVTCATAVVLAVIQYGDWLHPALVLGVFGIVQSVEGLVIQPKIIGDRVGLHPLTIIIAVMAGTTLLGGLLGGILAIPLTAALRVLMFRYVWKH
ncbi:MAG: AI-2E family transporter [Pedosphaera sp.]|nr:AI-2E family transporter [Pedosphaera sp.]